MFVAKRPVQTMYQDIGGRLQTRIHVHCPRYSSYFKLRSKMLRNDAACFNDRSQEYIELLCCMKTYGGPSHKCEISSRAGEAPTGRVGYKDDY